MITTPLLIVVTLAAFRQGTQGTQPRQKITELDVERINVVEPDGNYRMVISNRARSIGPIYKGKPFGYPGGTRPGIIFFNDEGTENGGLTFQGRRGPDGRFQAGHHLSFDQFDQDQVVVLNYQDNNGRRQMGLTFGDRADVNIFDLVQQRDSINKMADTAARNAALRQLMGPRNGVPLYAPRVYIGRDVNKNAVLNLADPTGKTRARFLVDSLGSARLEFLDSTGRVTYTVPDTSARRGL
jgi:hypothetical protein